MATATPIRPAPLDQDVQTADFTRPQDPFTLSNFARTSKRQQRSLNSTAPPRLDLGGSAHNNNNSNIASRAIKGQLDEIERQAKIQRAVIQDFAHSVNLFVSSHRQEEHSFAQELCSKIIGHLTASLQGDSTDPACSQSTHEAMTSGIVSFADMAKTLRNSGADFRSTKTPQPGGGTHPNLHNHGKGKEVGRPTPPRHCGEGSAAQ